MKLLLDTQILLWAAAGSNRLSSEALRLIRPDDNSLHFSAASLWEVVIKRALGREDFRVDPHAFRRGLLDNGYRELPVTSEHSVAVLDLPSIHKDPFDRMLVAQATIERLVLVTADRTLGAYPGPIRYV